MTVRDGALRWAARHWTAVGRVLPTRRLPCPVRGGVVYLSLANSPTTLQRVLRTYEPAKFANIRRFLPPGGVFVDVGANAGDFVVWAARCGGPGTRILAVEAEPDNAAWLRQTVQRNGLADAVTVVAAAAADRAGETELLVASTFGMHSIVETELHRSVESFRPRGRITVPTHPLDSLLAEAGLAHVDVVKIDVEGAEMLVLAGAPALLSAGEPLVLLIDLHFGVDTAELVELLHGHGFTIRLEDRPDEVVPSIPEHTLSVVAVRR